MSEGDTPSFIFMKPNWVISDKETKNPVLQMKRKEPSATDVYYLFKFIDENASSPEALKEIHEAFDEFMCPLAAIMGIGLFEYEEVSKKTHEAILNIGPENIPDKEQIDVEIDITNHATGQPTTLTVGISGPGYWGKTIDELEKEASGTGADNEHKETP